MLRNLSIQHKAALLVSVPFLLTAGLMVVLYEIGSDLDRSVAWTVHAHEVLAKIDETAQGIVTLHGENLQHALLGSHQSALPMHDRVLEAKAALTQLQGMVIDDPMQTALADVYAPRSIVLLDALEATHDELVAGKIATAAANCAANARELDAVLQLNGGLRTAERTMVVQRMERCRELARQRRMVLVLGGAAAVVFVFLLGGAMLRSMVRRLRSVEQAVERTSSDRELPPPIPARDEIGRIDTAVHDMVRVLRAQRSENDMFIYSVSHDLRSPLVNLQGFGKELASSVAELQTVLSSKNVPPELRQELDRIAARDIGEALHYIDLAVRRQASIIDSLLSLSRAGRVVYSWTDVDLQRVVDTLVAQLQNRRDLAGVEFAVGTLPTIRGDRLALERMFDNLLSNAVKFLAKDRQGRIEVGAVPADAANPDCIDVFVADNGIGIAAENLERVFVPFSRFAGREGEGIGLSLVRRIVERHHGHTWIESRLGAGTRVHVVLPREQQEPPAAPLSADGPSPPS